MIRGRYAKPGGGESRRRLRELGFDPIEVLVKCYEEVSVEITRQENIRDGVIVELKADGKEKKYYPEFHMSCIDRKADIAEKLIRYGYARVPETNDLNLGLTPQMTINLTDSDEQFLLNESRDEEEDEEQDGQPT